MNRATGDTPRKQQRTHAQEGPHCAVCTVTVPLNNKHPWNTRALHVRSICWSILSIYESLMMISLRSARRGPSALAVRCEKCTRQEPPRGPRGPLQEPTPPPSHAAPAHTHMHAEMAKKGTSPTFSLDEKKQA